MQVARVTSIEQARRRPSQKQWRALGAIMFGYFAILLDESFIAVANPVIMTDLQIDVGTVVWVISAYLLSYTAPLLVVGRLGDRFGAKRIYLSGLAVFTVASLCCGLSKSAVILIGARAVQGFGASLMTSQAMAQVTRTFRPDHRARAMSAFGTAIGLSMLVGPTLGGILIDAMGWQWIFYINSLIGATGLGLALWLVPASTTSSCELQVPSVLLCGAGMLLLILGIQQRGAGQPDARAWILAIAGLGCLITFVIRQAGSTVQPLIPLSIFRDRNFTLANVAISALTSALAMRSIPTYLFVQAIWGLSPVRTAVVFAPMALATSLFAPLVGRFADRVHPRTMPSIGLVLLAVSVFASAALMTEQPRIPAFMLVLAMAGAAIACIWGPLGAIATRGLSAEHAGAGSGVYCTSRQMGAILGFALAGAVIADRLTAHEYRGVPTIGGGSTTSPSSTALAVALQESTMLAPLILVLGAMACLLMVDTPAAH